MDYHSEFRQSIDRPEEFWRKKAAAIDWIEPPKPSGRQPITAMANGFRTASSTPPMLHLTPISAPDVAIRRR